MSGGSHGGSGDGSCDRSGGCSSEDQNRKDTERKDVEEERLVEAFLRTYARLQTRKSYRLELEKFFVAIGRGTFRGEDSKEKDSMGENAEGEDSKEEDSKPKKLRSISEEDLKVYLRRAKRERGPSAARRGASALKLFFQWAEEEGHLPTGDVEALTGVISDVREKL
jgi:integrase